MLDHVARLQGLRLKRFMDVNGQRRDAGGVTRAPAYLLVLGSVVCVQFGQAVGATLFSDVGPAGVVTLRLGFAALVLLVIARPSLPAAWSERLVILGFGTAIAGMNLVYPSLLFLPLGLATSLQLLGPIILALVLSKRLLHAGFAVLAGAGVWLFYGPGGDDYSLVGVSLALASGAAMAGYLLLSKRAGASAVTLGPLAWALLWAALLAAPLGIIENGSGLIDLRILLIGFTVAVLASVLPYSFEFIALRRLPPRTVGVMQSLEPAAAGLAGTLLLAQYLAPFQWLALVLVGAASAGVVAFGRTPQRSGPARTRTAP